MVAVITRPEAARAKPSVRPQLVLIPGGRPCSPVGDVARQEGPGSPLFPLTGCLPKPRPSHRIFRRRRMLLALALALGVVAGLWIVLRAIGGVAGGGPLTSSGAPLDGPSAAATGTAGTGSLYLASSQASEAHPTPGQLWVVRPGDTLWGIVESAGVRGDPRPVVDKLAAKLGGRPLEVGQTILVP